MKELDQNKTGTSCLYIDRLDDIDRSVPERLVVESVKFMRERHDVK